MKSYYQALRAASELGSMPDPIASPGKFIAWAEDICELLSNIYERSYEQVTEDLSECLGILDKDNEDN